MIRGYNNKVNMKNIHCCDCKIIEVCGVREKLESFISIFSYTFEERQDFIETEDSIRKLVSNKCPLFTHND